MSKKKKHKLLETKKRGFFHKEKSFTANSVYLSVAVVAIICFAAGFLLSGAGGTTSIFAVNSENTQAGTSAPSITAPDVSSEPKTMLYYIVSEGCSLCNPLEATATDIAEKLGAGVKVIEYTKKMSIPGYVLVYDDKLTINGIQSKYSFEQTVCNLTKNDDICEMAKKDKPEAEKPQTPEVPKSDKPEVEVFIMSHCPFGLQMEKAIIPVMETLGDKADIQIKWVNYAMHGEKEIQDNTREYCIQKEQNNKFTEYIRCFVKDGNAESCIETVGIDKNKLEKCMNDTDEEFGITEGYNDKTKWKGRFPPYPVHDDLNQKYGVRGSPTTVINGQIARISRSQQAVLDAVCAAFNNPPPECSTKLNSDGEKSGFGKIGVAGDSTSSGAGCGG
ncbi:MAG: hypothetical protein GXO64_00425 [Candidatus Micrarchaeota archaeon]|nr:hypothetical protein [Candidatus Micrarchaeota archaeon]